MGDKKKSHKHETYVNAFSPKPAQQVRARLVGQNLATAAQKLSKVKFIIHNSDHQPHQIKTMSVVENLCAYAQIGIHKEVVKDYSN